VAVAASAQPCAAGAVAAEGATRAAGVAGLPLNLAAVAVAVEGAATCARAAVWHEAKRTA
jgi:type IV secretory pathway VirB3-like protein